MHTLLPVGSRAPSFSLPADPQRIVSLAEFRGRPVVLAFYPADWSPVCGDQVALYSAIRREFEPFDAVILGVSVDGPWCHAAFVEARNLRITLLSDFEPKGAVARAYGAYDPAGGTAHRALFVIDREGFIQWTHLSPPDINPGAEGILAALERLVEVPSERTVS